MQSWISEQSPILLSFLAGLFTWGITAVGSGMVFFFREINRKLLDSMLGFAAGVMIAASFWSLLNPAIEFAEQQGQPGWLPATVGFFLGGACLWGLDRIIPHLHMDLPVSESEGIHTSWHRSILLVLAITLHNIPEGLAIGVTFGSLGIDKDTTSLTAAISLALGIGLQNFPEGAAVSIPLRRENFSRIRAFIYGQLSGIVEPISAVIGATTVMFITPILPYALAFAAGAMMFVVVEELIPESQQHGHSDLATLGCLAGFGLMMLLDVALG